MKKLFLALGLIAFTAPASAEVFVWTDPASRVEVAFPDNWMRQANLDDYLRLNILAPQGADHAACHLYVKDDPRYMDAPPSAQADVNQFVFTPEIIRQEIFERPDTNNVRISNMYPAAGLGPGAAVMAEVEFTKNWMGQAYPMHGQIFATLYHGKNIVFSCETTATGWDTWKDVVAGIAKSVTFPVAWTLTPNSYYRPFQLDGGVILPQNRKANANAID